MHAKQTVNRGHDVAWADRGFGGDGAGFVAAADASRVAGLVAGLVVPLLTILVSSLAPWISSDAFAQVNSKEQQAAEREAQAFADQRG